MPTSTATYAKNSVVLNAAFVSVLRRRTPLRGVEMALSLRSVTPPRVGAEVLTCGPPWDGGGRIAGGPSRSARGGRPSRTSGREESQARELAGPARPDRNYPSVSDRQTFGPSGKPPDPRGHAQITFSSTSRTRVPITERRIEPRHPSPLEKKT